MAESAPKSVSPGPTQSPYQINFEQTLKASTALLQHVRQEAKRLKEVSSRRTLLGDEDDGSDSEEHASLESPVWLNLTTKKHIVDKNRLKPGKIAVPHSINSSPSLSICLITADPQRAVKDVIADPTFPAALSSRIGRIIGYSKLKAKYRSFESRRQLLAEHDVFLADDRIITRLVDTLGKTFYKDTAKRPIPIRIAKLEKVDGKRIKSSDKKPSKEDHPATVASPSVVAKEIESAINAVPISLKPGTSAAVRVGRASFNPSQLSENISTVVAAMIERYVARGWRNVKSIHIKTPNSAALPIWLADDLWVTSDDVIKDEEQVVLQEKQDADKASKRPEKRKAETDATKPGGPKQQKKQDADKAPKRPEQRKAETNAPQPDDPKQQKKQDADKEPTRPEKRKAETDETQPGGLKQQKKKKLLKTTGTTKEGAREGVEARVLDAARKAKLAKQKARALQAHP